jgi:type IV pilus assembly protein PilC
MDKRHYQWVGRDRTGQMVSGLMLAKSPDQVRDLLKIRRIRATQIRRHWALNIKRVLKPAIKPRYIARFTRQLATLLSAGIPLLQAFDALDRGELDSPLKDMLQDVRTQLEQGSPLHQALKRHTAFDIFYCNLVMTGELSGTLDRLLERIALHLEKTETLRASVRSALIYPCAILATAALVLTLILIFVVPAFQNIFASFGADLPWATRVVIMLSEGLQQYGVAALGTCLILAWGAKRMVQKNTRWQHHLHGLLLILPIAGSLTRHACTARWSRTLATLFAAGIPLTEALDAVAGVTGNVRFETATQSMQRQLIGGQSLSQALSSTQGLFPAMVVQMCAIGEESGALDSMLDKTAAHYEHDVENTVSRLTTLLEPIIMVVLGLLIGGLVLALYLPIFQMGQVI